MANKKKSQTLNDKRIELIGFLEDEGREKYQYDEVDVKEKIKNTYKRLIEGQKPWCAKKKSVMIREKNQWDQLCKEINQIFTEEFGKEMFE